MQQPLPKPNPRHSSLFGAMYPRSRPCRTRHTLLRWVKSTAENVKSPRNLRCRCLCGVRLKASCCVPGQQKKIFPMYSVKEVSLDPQRGDLLDAGVSPRPPYLPSLVGRLVPPARGSLFQGLNKRRGGPSDFIFSARVLPLPLMPGFPSKSGGEKEKHASGLPCGGAMRVPHS